MAGAVAPTVAAMHATLGSETTEPAPPADVCRILLVEDEPLVADVVRRYLSLAGYEVTVAPNGSTGLAAMAKVRPSLVILDLNLPGMDGMEVFRRLRSGYDTPVIVLTCRASEADRVAGLDAGVEDYVTKPFFPKELVARVRRELLRMRPGVSQPVLLTGGPLELDTGSCRLLRSGRPVLLTHLEFDLLAYLMRRPAPVSPDHLGAARAVLGDVRQAGGKVESQVLGEPGVGDVGDHVPDRDAVHPRLVERHGGEVALSVDRDDALQRHLAGRQHVGAAVDRLGGGSSRNAQSESP